MYRPNWKYLKKQEIKVVLQDWHIIILVHVNVFLREGGVYLRFKGLGSKIYRMAQCRGGDFWTTNPMYIFLGF